jgi:hypothetical protein
MPVYYSYKYMYSIGHTSLYLSWKSGIKEKFSNID